MPFPKDKGFTHTINYCKLEAMNSIDQDFGLSDLIGRTLHNPNNCCWAHIVPSRPQRFGAFAVHGSKSWTKIVPVDSDLTSVNCAAD